MSTPISEFPQASTAAPTFSFGGYADEPYGLEGVTFWPRVAARLIDYAVHYCVTYSAGFLFSLMVVLATGGHMPMWVLARLKHPGLIGLFFGALGFVMYHVICLSMHGSTLGKRLLSMVVVQENGTRCRVRPAILRELAYFIDSLFFGLIGYLAMQDSFQQQRYGDRWARTVVCKRAGVIPEQLRRDSRFILALLLAVMIDAGLAMISLLVIIGR